MIINLGSSETLNAILTLGFGVVAVLLAILLAYLIAIIYRVLKIIRTAERVVDKIDAYISRPISAFSSAVDKLAPVIDFFARRGRGKGK